MGARARGDLSPRIAVPREERKFPRCDYISEASMHVCIYIWLARFSAGGTSLSPGVGHARLVHFFSLHLIASLSPPLSRLFHLRRFVSPPSFLYTEPSSLPAGHRIPICSLPSPLPSERLPWSSFFKVLPLLPQPPFFTACLLPSPLLVHSYIHAFVAGFFEASSVPDTLSYTGGIIVVGCSL